MRISYSIIMLIAVLFSGCLDKIFSDDKANETSTVTFKGVLDSSLVPTASIVKSIGNIGDISQIVACALDKNGEFDPDRTQTVTVQTDGSFSMNLPTDAEWILMTGNASATTLEARIGNFIALSEDNNTRLNSLPLFNATGEIDAGFLSAFADETLSSNTLSQLNTAFGLPSESLIQLSHIDALTKAVKNNYLNNAPNSNIRFKYGLRFAFDFVDVPWSADSFSDVSRYTILSNLFFIYSNHPSFAVDHNLTLIAPDNLTQTTLTVGDAVVYYSPSLIATTNITYPLPQGFYKLNDANQTLAIFDLEGTDIYDADGNFTGIMPSVKLRVNADGNATGMYIAFHGFNKSANQFEKITNQETIQRYMRLAWLDFGAVNTFIPFSYDLLLDQMRYTEFISGTSGVITFTNGDFYMPFPGTTLTSSAFDPNDVIGISIRFFSMGGVELDFDFGF